MGKCKQSPRGNAAKKPLASSCSSMNCRRLALAERLSKASCARSSCCPSREPCWASRASSCRLQPLRMRASWQRCRNHSTVQGKYLWCKGMDAWGVTAWRLGQVIKACSACDDRAAWLQRSVCMCMHVCGCLHVQACWPSLLGTVTVTVLLLQAAKCRPCV